MREAFIKIGAYIIMTFGIAVFLAFLGLSIYLFVAYPDFSAQKKALVGSGFLIVGVVEMIVTISIFEAMIELTRIEEKVDPLESKGKDRDDG
jgi:Mg2+/citrate symporter